MKIIFTKHALVRIEKRKMSKSQVEECVRSPDKKVPGKESGTTEYIKKNGKRIVTAIGKQETGEVIVLSCWIDPPMPGTHDEEKRDWYKRYKRAGFWQQIGMQLLRIFKP